MGLVASSCLLFLTIQCFETRFLTIWQVHSELRKWLHANTSSEVAATTRIIYGGLFLILSLIALDFVLCAVVIFSIRRQVKCIDLWIMWLTLAFAHIGHTQLVHIWAMLYDWNAFAYLSTSISFFFFSIYHLFSFPLIKRKIYIFGGHLASLKTWVYLSCGRTFWFSLDIKSENRNYVFCYQNFMEAIDVLYSHLSL